MQTSTARSRDAIHPETLELSWEFGGQVSWVNVRLTELSGDGTRLRLECRGPGFASVGLFGQSEMFA